MRHKSKVQRMLPEKNSEYPALCAFLSADSTLYEGSVCPLSVMSKAHSRQQPQRHGYGKLVCADGTVYDGLWQSDTLTYGTRTDSLGVYCGQFNASLQAHGTGRMYYSNGEFYAGTWKANKRSGHGFSLSAKRAVYCGVWGNDRFRGEQLILPPTASMASTFRAISTKSTDAAVRFTPFIGTNCAYAILVPTAACRAR